MEELVITGPVITIVVGAVGIHMPTGTGIHGPGVKTPSAAAVNAAVVGLHKLVHKAKGGTFKKGIQSVHAPTGIPHAIVIDVGRNVSGIGAIPKEHLAKDPVVAIKPIIYTSLRSFKSPSSSYVSIYPTGTPS